MLKHERKRYFPSASSKFDQQVGMIRSSLLGEGRVRSFFLVLPSFVLGVGDRLCSNFLASLRIQVSAARFESVTIG